MFIRQNFDLLTNHRPVGYLGQTKKVIPKFENFQLLPRNPLVFIGPQHIRQLRDVRGHLFAADPTGPVRAGGWGRTPRRSNTHSVGLLGTFSDRSGFFQQGCDVGGSSLHGRGFGTRRRRKSDLSLTIKTGQVRERCRESLNPRGCGLIGAVS